MFLRVCYCSTRRVRHCVRLNQTENELRCRTIDRRWFNLWPFTSEPVSVRFPLSSVYGGLRATVEFISPDHRR